MWAQSLIELVLKYEFFYKYAYFWNFKIVLNVKTKFLFKRNCFFYSMVKYYLSKYLVVMCCVVISLKIKYIAETHIIIFTEAILVLPKSLIYI